MKKIPAVRTFVKPFPPTVALWTTGLVFILLALFSPVGPMNAGTFRELNLNLSLQKPNEIRMDSIIASPGQLVSVTISITNERPVGLMVLRMSYDHNFLSFQSATPALRVAGWPIFDDDADTLPGEIHVVGVANSSSIMQPGSGEVGYLNFQVVNQPIPPGTAIPMCYVFRKLDDNTMNDDSGNIIDSTQIDFVCGEIALISTGIADQYKNRPEGFELGQNYPNPFNPSTSFTLSLPKAGRYSVRIYNLAGQVVKTFEGEAAAGRQTLTWDGRDSNGNLVSSGIYFYKAEAGKFVSIKRMMLIK